MTTHLQKKDAPVTSPKLIRNILSHDFWQSVTSRL